MITNAHYLTELQSSVEFSSNSKEPYIHFLTLLPDNNITRLLSSDIPTPTPFPTKLIPYPHT